MTTQTRKKRKNIDFETKVAAIAAINEGLRTNRATAMFLGVHEMTVSKWRNDPKIKVEADKLASKARREIAARATKSKPDVKASVAPVITVRRSSPLESLRREWPLFLFASVAIAGVVLSIYSIATD